MSEEFSCILQGYGAEESTDNILQTQDLCTYKESSSVFWSFYKGLDSTRPCPTGAVKIQCTIGSELVWNAMLFRKSLYTSYWFIQDVVLPPALSAEKAGSMEVIFLFLAHLNRRLKWAFLIKICPLFVVVVVVVVVNFSHFHLLLQNHWANFNQTWHKTSLGEGNSSLFKWRAPPFSKQR